MARFVVHRVGALLVTLFVASFLIFGALYLAPGDPATLLAGGHATPAVLQQIRIQDHLNEPFLSRYWLWLTGVLHGNLGQSFVYRANVTTLLAPRVGNTVFLVIYASILILGIGITLGLFSALRRRLGSVATVGTAVGMATPAFVAAIVLILVFAVDLGWFPVFGAGSGFTDRLRHLTLPAIALALSWVAYVTQITKASVREELGREHVETARSRGIPWRLIVSRHVFRNALIPVTTVAGLTVAGLIAGAVVVEDAFGLNGIGSLLVQAALQKDFAVVQAIALLLVTTFVIANAVVDLVNGLLDPRVRLSRSG
ncbi:MAG: ABC transporter permease [Thermoleophilia bacterium]